jgi:hypothetical protein
MKDEFLLSHFVTLLKLKEKYENIYCFIYNSLDFY